jgi:hypothetical protein
MRTLRLALVLVPILMMLRFEVIWSFAVSKKAFGPNSCTNKIDDNGNMELAKRIWKRRREGEANKQIVKS